MTVQLLSGLPSFTRINSYGELSSFSTGCRRPIKSGNAFSLLKTGTTTLSPDSALGDVNSRFAEAVILTSWFVRFCMGECGINGCPRDGQPVATCGTR